MCRHACYLTVVQLYTDKTMCNDKTEVHAFQVGLLNADYNAKIKHLTTLALIPVIKPRAGLTDNQLTEARRDLMCQAIHSILDTLKQASHTGMEISLADGSRHWVFPRALSYVADDPEQHAVLQILSGVQTKRQCCRCYITSHELSAVELRAELRTLEKQQCIRRHILRTYSTSTKKAGDAVCSEFGTHPDNCGLSGLAGEDKDACKYALDPGMHLTLLTRMSAAVR